MTMPISIWEFLRHCVIFDFVVDIMNLFINVLIVPVVSAFML